MSWCVQNLTKAACMNHEMTEKCETITVSDNGLEAELLERQTKATFCT